MILTFKRLQFCPTTGEKSEKILTVKQWPNPFLKSKPRKMKS